MNALSPSGSSLRTALVLGGGAARGAYEAGVIAYLRDELARELGRGPLPIDLIAGTSVGAINGCHLAAISHDPARQSTTLIDNWRSLRVENVLRFGPGDLLRVSRALLRRRSPGDRLPGRIGLVDPAGLREIIHREISWSDISRNIETGVLLAVSITATHVASGRSTVFIQHRADPRPKLWNPPPSYRCVETRLGLVHAMASASIPVLFPPIAIGGELYVDGGLRQSVPISPVLRLGAQRIMVVSLNHKPETDTLSSAGERLGPSEIAPAPDPRQDPGPRPDTEQLRVSEEALLSGASLLGKALNAVMLDRADDDLARLRRFNSILEAGTRAFGPTFESTLDRALEPLNSMPLRYVRNILIHPSQDLGVIAADYATSGQFKKRTGGFAGRVLRRLTESEAPGHADLASYLMFDGGFADILIQLGRADARARFAEWSRFWSDLPESDAEAAQMEKLAVSGASFPVRIP